jgi:MYXO-CTERM domain-containing protein
MRTLTPLVVASALFSLPAAATTVSLDFDSTSENCCFSSESPPGTDYFSSHGIEFTTTLEVLDQSGNFGVSGYSAPNFLAWNTSFTGTSVDMAFTENLSSFSLGYASPYSGSITLTAYDSSGSYVDSDSASSMSTSLQTLTVEGSGIVDIAVSLSGSVFGVLDDFVWEVSNDADNDGYTEDVDCDDTDPSVNPGATEYCDTIDNNCDGNIDEDSAVDALNWYLDSDADGYGDANNVDVECYAPTGYVADDTDCDDSDSNTYPGADEYCDGHDDDCDGDIDEDSSLDVSTWYADTDSDGFGDSASTDIDCYEPTGYVADDTDCDDTDSDTYPGAEEWCDGHDDDCDGDIDEDDSMDSITWYADSDGDGEGDPAVRSVSCYGTIGYVENSTDCDDTSAVLNTSDADGDGFTTCDSDCDDTDATINVDATEIWYDGVDQDCDGWSDYDQDYDGFDHQEYGGDDCDDEDADINVDATEIYYDGVDQNCDNLSDYDADEDGQDSESYGGEDCDDADPDTYTGAPDNPYDGIITDCLNSNDYDADGDGFLAAEYGGKDCDDANSDVYPGAEEIWYDGIDQDCDGNDDDQDGDGYALDDDCDDEDADSWPDNGSLDADCNPFGVDDTGDTGEAYGSLDKDGGCFSSTTGGKPLGPWALLLAGLLLIRRRSK